MEWIVPNNSNKFNIEQNLNTSSNIIMWKVVKNANIKVNDTIYFYVSEQIHRIKYKFYVTAIKRFSPSDGHKSLYLELKLISNNLDKFPLDSENLRKNGLSNFQSSTKLDKNNQLMDYITQTIASSESKYVNPDSSLLVDKYANNLINSKNIILHGAPGTGKTYLAKQIAMAVTGINMDGNEKCEEIKLVQFHPSYDYSDFVEGLRPSKIANNQISFDLIPGVFTQFCDRAREQLRQDKQKHRESQKFVFIIDEINRGEISKIFGELFFSIDPDYRGPKGKVTTQYTNMHKNSDYHFNEDFYVPENVYILGTMNDIDRSVENIDFAMRRRFRFIRINAKDQINMLKKLNNPALISEAQQRLKSLNRAISSIAFLGNNFEIGPSYFLKLNSLNDSFEELWTDYLLPLLQEYITGYTDYTDTQKILKQLKGTYSLRKDETDENNLE